MEPYTREEHEDIKTRADPSMVWNRSEFTTAAILQRLVEVAESYLAMRIVITSTRPRARSWTTPWQVQDGTALFSMANILHCVDDRIPEGCVGYVRGKKIVLYRMTEPPERLDYTLPVKREPNDATKPQACRNYSPWNTDESGDGRTVDPRDCYTCNMPESAHAPVFPDIGCKGECGFVVAGVGLQCQEGSACGRYLHPGDEHYAEVAAYYRSESQTEDDMRELEASCCRLRVKQGHLECMCGADIALTSTLDHVVAFAVRHQGDSILNDRTGSEKS